MDELSMSKRRFYWEWFKRTFGGKLLISAGWAGVLTILSGIVAWWWKPLEGVLNIIPFVVFGAVLIGTIIIGFVLAPYYLYKVIEGKCKKLQAQLDTRPSIIIKPINEVDAYYLEVKNIGGTGIFEAEIQIIDSDDYIPPHLRKYMACWLNTGDKATEIISEASDRIKVAKFSSSPPDFVSQHLYIYYFSTNTHKESFESMSTHWVGATVTHADGKEEPLKPKYYLLRLKIMAREGLKDGVVSRDYKLSLGGLEGV